MYRKKLKYSKHNRSHDQLLDEGNLVGRHLSGAAGNTLCMHARIEYKRLMI